MTYKFCYICTCGHKNYIDYYIEQGESFTLVFNAPKDDMDIKEFNFNDTSKIEFKCNNCGLTFSMCFEKMKE